MIYPYRETLLSQLYPGNQHSTHCLQAAVEGFEEILNLPKKKRLSIVWRLDGGFGADKHINWLVDRNYQVIAKGASSSRSPNLGRQVKRWLQVGHSKWVARVKSPAIVKPQVQTFPLRYLTKERYKYRYLYSTLGLYSRKTLQFYDYRGGAETEFRADKTGGLLLHTRRKQKWEAQVAWILLTDIVHNYLSWFSHHILADSPFASWGPLRITRDLFRIPGHITLSQDGLLFVSLSKSHPFAADLLPCLARFWM